MTYHDRPAVIPRYKDPVIPRHKDQTAVIPRQHDPQVEYHPERRDRWDDSAVTDDVDLAARSARAMATLAWLLPTLVMGALGFVRTTWPSLNARELAVWGAATTPRPELTRLLHEYGSPYPLLMNLWAHLAGASDLALRVPSVLFATATCGLVAHLGTRLGSAKVGFIAGMLLAVLPAMTQIAQTAGPQAFTLMTTVLTSVTLVRVLDRPSVGTAAVHAVTTMLLLTQLETTPVVIAHLLIVVTMRRRAVGPWLAATVVGAAPAAALHVLVLRTSLSGSSAIPALGDMASSMFGTALLGGVIVGLTTVSLSAEKPAMAFTALAAMPLLCAAALAPVTSMSPVDLAVTAVPGFAVLAAYTLRGFPAVRGVMVVAIAAVLGFTAHQAIRRTDGHGQAGRDVATTIAAELQAGDAIVHGADEAEAATSRDLVARYLPERLRPKDALLTTPPRRDGRLYAGECPKVAECLGDAPRVWVIRLGAVASPLDGFPPAKDGHLRSNYGVAKQWTYRGVALFLLAKSSGK